MTTPPTPPPEQVVQLNKTSFPINQTITPKDKNIISNFDRKNLHVHPLNFYALGEVSPEYEPQFGSTFLPSRGFRSTSNDLLHRNVFSLNSRYYDELKNQTKKLSTLKEQNIEENNYMQPLSLYNSFHKYDIPLNACNMATLHLAREKLYASQNYSTIKNGQKISRKEFYEQKDKLIKDENKETNKYKNLKISVGDWNNVNNKGISSNTSGVTNRGRSLDQKAELKKKILEENKNNNDNNDKNNRIQTEEGKNHRYDLDNSNTLFVCRDPNDYSKKQLRTNYFQFDRNNNQFLKIRNWWKLGQ